MLAIAIALAALATAVYAAVKAGQAYHAAQQALDAVKARRVPDAFGHGDAPL